MSKLTLLIRVLTIAMVNCLWPCPIYSQTLSIDGLLQQSFDIDGVSPGPLTSDSEFLRRVSLDLIGRIPTTQEVQDFLNSDDLKKRDLAIERLILSDEHDVHVANIWCELLIPEVRVEPQLRYFRDGFTAWLVDQQLQNVGFDKTVRALIAPSISNDPLHPQLVLTEMKSPNPLAYIATKEADPAKLASSTLRVFAGIQLECAQCHNHPYDHWSQEQFWQQAAFFSGLKRQGKSFFSPLTENRTTLTVISIAETDKKAAAVFLDGRSLVSESTTSPRDLLADWIVSPENPYFAKAIANRVWGEMMGRGIVQPVDDFSDANPASHPELLDFLASEFRRRNFDLDHLYRQIALSQAYQRTSRNESETTAESSLFSRARVKPLSAQQFVASLSVATGSSQTAFARFSDQYEELFSLDPTITPETSIALSLMLKNGKTIGGLVDSQSNPRLKKLLSDSTVTNDQIIDELYLSILSRHPSDEELTRAKQYFKSESITVEMAAADLLWVLINSPEFRWNH